MAGALLHTESMPQPDLALRSELRARLRALRLARGMSQAQLGVLLGVNQKRVARIEAAPDLASLGQIHHLVVLLGGSMDIMDARISDSGEVRSSLKQGRGRPSRASGPVLQAKLARGGRVATAGLRSEELSQESEEARPGTTWSASWD